MQPVISEEGNKQALLISKRAEECGITRKFNEDPQVSVDTFKFYQQYSWFHPDTREVDKNVYATLIRECLHFEVETFAGLLTMGMDVAVVFPTITLSYMYRSCRAVLKDKFPEKGLTDSFAEEFARVLVQEVYSYLRDQLRLPEMNWVGASANML
ncbi:hypothetical protein CANINC_002172 [Pichia inconspicua]|uniref:Uncharacterized protein n=1 Tax=Pichia inconspicua TaxID=52247 RepID=A0A4T0X1U7_9ASCO|nr:hypothetical protein CANINC_002172 [[Candida] inconspicua]